jgi:hypothetical protein
MGEVRSDSTVCGSCPACASSRQQVGVGRSLRADDDRERSFLRTGSGLQRLVERRARPTDLQPKAVARHLLDDSVGEANGARLLVPTAAAVCYELQPTAGDDLYDRSDDLSGRDDCRSLLC